MNKKAQVLSAIFLSLKPHVDFIYLPVLTKPK